MKKYGFTLAEVMIALGIISTVVVLLTGIMIKKVRLNNPFASNAGLFVCYKDVNSAGNTILKQATLIKNVLKVEDVTSKGKCEHEFPNNVKSFAITLVGAGGGGAGGKILASDRNTAHETCLDTLTVPTTSGGTITNNCANHVSGTYKGNYLTNFNSKINTAILENAEYTLDAPGGASTSGYIWGYNDIRWGCGNSGGTCTWKGDLKVGDAIAVDKGNPGEPDGCNALTTQCSGTSCSGGNGSKCTSGCYEFYSSSQPCRVLTSAIYSPAGTDATFKLNGSTQMTAYGGYGGYWPGDSGYKNHGCPSGSQNTSLGGYDADRRDGKASATRGSASCNYQAAAPCNHCNNVATGNGRGRPGDPGSLKGTKQSAYQLSYRTNRITGSIAQGGQKGAVEKTARRSMPDNKVVIMAADIGEPGKGGTIGNPGTTSDTKLVIGSSTVIAKGGAGGSYDSGSAYNVYHATDSATADKGYILYAGKNGVNSSLDRGGKPSYCGLAASGTTAKGASQTCTNSGCIAQSYANKCTTLEGSGSKYGELAKEYLFNPTTYGSGGGAGSSIRNYDKAYNSATYSTNANSTNPTTTVISNSSVNSDTLFAGEGGHGAGGAIIIQW